MNVVYYVLMALSYIAQMCAIISLSVYAFRKSDY